MSYDINGKIGLITPAAGFAMEMDFHRYLPAKTAVLTQRMQFDHVDIDGLKMLRSRALEAAEILAAGNPDIMIFGCTAGSFIGGMGYDEDFIKEAEALTGIPMTTTTTAVLEAIKELDAKKIMIVTPYSDEVNKTEKEFFIDNGIVITDIAGLGLTEPSNMPKVKAQELVDLIQTRWKNQEDLIFISCTGLDIMGEIEDIQKQFGVPVLTSNQVSLWYCLKRLGTDRSLIPGARLR